MTEELDDCPHCGNKVNDGSGDSFDGDIYRLQYDCEECGTSWYAVYEFTHKEVIEDA